MMHYMRGFDFLTERWLSDPDIFPLVNNAIKIHSGGRYITVTRFMQPKTKRANGGANDDI